jgi:inner membrane protein
MRAITHVAFSVTLTSLALSTADPIALGIGAFASQLPDIDTSKSVIGRVFFPISHFLEKRYPHRTLTHSFLFTGIFTLVTYPIALYTNPLYWQALVWGFFTGWFGDVFTKTGVAAFYPSTIRLVIPGNPRMRLSTGSQIEWFILGLLVTLAIILINLNSSGGLIRGFNQWLGFPSGAIESVQEDASRYLLIAEVKGRNAITQQPVEGNFEVVQPLTSTDLLVKDGNGIIYRLGRSQECQIIVNQMRIHRLGRIDTQILNLILSDEDLLLIMSQLPNQGRTYINGIITLEDAEDLLLPTYPDRFNTITLQPRGDGVSFAHLNNASPNEVITFLGDYYATGNLIVRIINLQNQL